MDYFVSSAWRYALVLDEESLRWVKRLVKIATNAVKTPAKRQSKWRFCQNGLARVNL